MHTRLFNHINLTEIEKTHSNHMWIIKYKSGETLKIYY